MERLLALMQLPQTYFCLSAAIFLLCIAVGAAVGIRPYRSKNILTLFRVLCTGIFLSGWALLYAVYFFDSNTGKVWHGDTGKALFLSFQHAVRLFLMDGGFGNVLEMISGWQEGARVCFAHAAAVLYLLAPLTTAGFVLSFIKSLSARARYALSAPWRERHIFSELNEKSLALAESLVRPYTQAATGGSCDRIACLWRLPVLWARKPQIVFAGIKGKDTPPELIERAKEIGAVLYPTDIGTARLWAFPWQKRSLYLISDSEAEKIRHAAGLMAGYNRKNTSLYLFSRSAEAQCFLSSYNKEMGEKTDMAVVLVNDIRALVYHDLEENGIKLFEGALKKENGLREIRAVIVGFGRYGVEMTKALLWYCQLPGYSVHIKVLDEREDAASRFEALCPDIKIGTAQTAEGDMQYSIRFVKASAGTKALLDEIGADTTYAFVCLGSDEQNIDTALEIRRELNCRDRQGTPVETVIYDTDVKERLSAAWHGTENDSGIRIIGDLVSFYSEGTVINSRLLRESFQVHLRWESCVGIRARNNFYTSDYNVHSSLAKTLHASLRARILSLEERVRAAYFPFLDEAKGTEAAAYLQILRHTASNNSAMRFSKALNQISEPLYTKLAALRYQALETDAQQACLARLEQMAEKKAEGTGAQYLRADAYADLIARIDRLDEGSLSELKPLYRVVTEICYQKAEKGRRQVRLEMEYAALNDRDRAEVDAFMQNRACEYSLREAFDLARYAACVEHIRWLAYMRTEGYRPAELTDKGRLAHCDLVAVDDLTFADRIKDI